MPQGNPIMVHKFPLASTAIGTSLFCIAALTGCVGSTVKAGAHSPQLLHRDASSKIVNSLSALEKKYGAQIGVCEIDSRPGSSLGYRQNTRFAYDSTAKALTAGLILKVASDVDLQKVIHFSKNDLLKYAPITSQHLKTGMTMKNIVAAALRYSDNTAANLMTEYLGGPTAVQAKLSAMGDNVTKFNRTEPNLNTAVPGDMRDTTTPDAMAFDITGFAVGSFLTPERRMLYNSLLESNTTGGPYIRAGVPRGWVVGDKTGAGGHGSRNDVGFIKPPNKSPTILVIFTNRKKNEISATDDSLIRKITQKVIQAQQ